jgi:hypothetical protein
MQSRLQEFNDNYVRFFLLSKYNIKNPNEIPKIDELKLYLKLNNIEKSYYKIAF